MLVKDCNLDSLGEIVPDKYPFGLSGCPMTERLWTRLSAPHDTPFHLQQSEPVFHEVRMPDGSDVIPDLKAKRPFSSSTLHFADVSVREVKRRIRESKDMFGCCAS